MKYQPAINIWDLSDEQRRKLPIGQWVYAGDPTNKGRFYGQGRSAVVAWNDLGRRKVWKSYCKALYDYGQTVIHTI